jgi:hypothetical protein
MAIKLVDNWHTVTVVTSRSFGADPALREAAWRGRLAREQIWAILYFLEFQSGGIEGRFPPSPLSKAGRRRGQRALTFPRLSAPCPGIIMAALVRD